MITTKYVRDHINEIKKSMEIRKSDYPIDELLELDEKVRVINNEIQILRTKRNAGSLKISEIKKSGSGDTSELVKELADTKNKIDELELQLPKYDTRIDFLLWNMPNTLQDSVPYGVDDTQNVELRKYGDISNRKGYNHEEVLKKLGLLDTEQAAKVAGARFFYLKGDLALMEQSLIRFGIDIMIEKGYTLIIPPLMLKKEYYKGTTALADFEELIYRVADTHEAESNKNFEHTDNELELIATSEHSIAAMHADTIFSASQLPLRYIGVSPCFRREAGSHGKDTKGIFRTHQFDKVEQFVFSNQEDSLKLHEQMVEYSEEVWKKLEIPYRVVNICTGDIGSVAAKKYDIEGYMPGQGDYRELGSLSNCTDWQSMRLNIRYDDKGERKYVHTLNATVISLNRAIVAIVENYTNDDGTITVPEALVPYMKKRKIG
jgi:seryl-tRNA synthetase